MNIEQSVIDMYEEFMNNISNDDNVQSASNVSMEQNLNNRIENHSDHGDGSINGATNINGNHNDCVNRDDIANHNGSLNPTNDETNNHSPNHNINDNIPDVHVKVLRDYGITVGNTNSNMLIRRELHVAQDDVHIKLTLWNDQAKKISGTIINKYLKLKHVKADWFNGARTLISMPNTRVAIV
ncbi:unnamed protein product [Rotaria sp. Silwood1]|nr:unnamed protein product [Rotaria sp. Silwood1]